jgi:uncharacterized coiled-coil protein SlyX
MLAHLRLLILLVLFIPFLVTAQETSSASLEARITRQQQQIDELRAQLEAQSDLLERLRRALPAAAAVVTPQPTAFVAPSSPPPVLSESPRALHVGRVSITPGGFLDLTAVYRSAQVGSGTSTPFNNIPYGNTAQGRLSEFRFSALSSRFTVDAKARLGGADISGYLESDFLGNAPTNVSISNNGSSARLRLAWVNIARGKWELLAGQAYSFLTPNRVGIYAAPTEVFTTRVSDPNLHVGVTSSRAPQVRFVYHATKGLALGLALENPEQFIGGGVVLPSALASTYNTELNNGSLSLPFGTPNLHPDVIPKVTYDGHAGTHALHLEGVGLFRTFRTYNPLTLKHFTASAGGVSINGNIALSKTLTYFADSFASDGGGRYSYGLGPDLTVRPDGSPSPIKSATLLSGFEYKAGSNLLLYSYYGAGYFQRNFAQDRAGVFSGFGYPGSPGSANRVVEEATFGTIRTIWKDPQYGALQVNSLFSYLTRSPWYAAPHQPRSAHLGQIYIDMRYVLP